MLSFHFTVISGCSFWYFNAIPSKAPKSYTKLIRVFETSTAWYIPNIVLKLHANTEMDSLFTLGLIMEVLSENTLIMRELTRNPVNYLTRFVRKCIISGSKETKSSHVNYQIQV